MTRLAVFMALTLATWAWAGTGETKPAGGTSLGWQKVALENELLSKINRALAPVIAEREYVVNVTVQLQHRSQGSGGKSFRDGIALDKLAMDGPVIGTETDDQNLFKNISNITASVLLDESVAVDKEDTVQTIVGEILDSFGKEYKGVKTEVKVERAQLRSLENRRSWTEGALPAAAAAAAILGAFLFLIAFYVMGELRKIQPSPSPQSVSTRGTDEEAGHAAKAAKAAEIPAAPAPDDLPGLQRFQALLTSSAKRAAALVRQWARDPRGGHGEALALLAAELPAAELQGLLAHLSAEDRARWNSVLGSRPRLLDARSADAVLARQSVSSILAPESPADDALAERLAELSPQKCAEIAARDALAGLALAQVVPAASLARVFAALPALALSELSSLSLSVTPEKMKQALERLGSEIESERKQAKSFASAFPDKAAELLPALDAEKEAAVFGSIAESGEFEVLERIARRVFPSELIQRLPQVTLKTILMRLPVRRRAEVILASPEQTRAALLDSLGKSGSRSREMIETEMREAQADPGSARTLEKARTELWREFVGEARSWIHVDQNAAEQASEILDSWLHEKSSGQVGRRNDSDGLAA